ncbi:glycosyltransferase family 4 protein [Mesoterricola sediminis]|uniref:Glycosyltransferase WbuB n=1 Tax=Mesoterricola sediminis TaxID=2927980 RepID=A0AA48GLT8_9BACT|nr:glycosyltransferase family 4 protein [Mesoterricola sediminis]BDU75446.1 glycosyltransferase WbuB [Mesoterricola sediminis]
MNILIINPYALDPDQAGGTRHFSLARALQARGHRVMLAAASFDHGARVDVLPPGPPAARRDRHGVAFLRLRTPPYRGNGAGRLWNMVAFGRAVERVLPAHLDFRPDVVVGSSPHPFGARGGLRLARRMGVPFVLELRDVWPQSLTDVMGVPPWHPVIWLLGRLERELYRGADHIITLLAQVGPRVAARGGDPEALTWVPNGIDLGLVPTPGPPADAGPFTILYAGSHGVTNALDVLVDAAAELRGEAGPDGRPYRFVLLGTGPEKPALEARAARLGLDALVFRPPVPKRAVYGCLAEADAFWVSARDSGLWDYGISFNKLYDFMAMARPTLAGVRSPGNPILLSGGGLMVAPGSARAMADGVRALAAAGPGARREMGERARAYVAAHFDMAHLAARFETALEAALAQARRVRGGAHAR